MTQAAQGQRVYIPPMLNLLRDQHSLQELNNPLCRLAVPFRRNRAIFPLPAISRASTGQQVALKVKDEVKVEAEKRG